MQDRHLISIIMKSFGIGIFLNYYSFESFVSILMTQEIQKIQLTNVIQIYTRNIYALFYRCARDAIIV